MKNLIILLCIGSLLTLSCNQTKNDKTDLPDANQLIRDSLTTDLEEIYKQGYLNGVGVAIVNENEVLFYDS